ncbi:hypothetical protein B566_EDAN015422 [Ephemera danica]|nr:hypothetical protein B566_EDAN015422 [Ephemera danica]
MKMAPQKRPQAGRSADATQHAPQQRATSQWVIEEIDVYGGTNEEEPNEQDNQQQYFDAVEIEMSPKAKKPRPPRKQLLQQRIITKGSPLREDESDHLPLHNDLDLSEVGLVEEVVTSLEREWCREGNSAAATLAALEGKSNEDEPAWD